MSEHDRERAGDADAEYSVGGSEKDKKAIADFWAASPETYSADRHGGSSYVLPDGSFVTVQPGSRESYELMDSTQRAWNHPLHATQPFDRIFPYARYHGKEVLEIGCGQGGMAQLWAERGARVTAVDLNPDAITKTRRRFELFDLATSGHRIQQEDANRLSFDDASFDYVYSWGVLHHSPNLQRSVDDALRVLKPGGEFGVMLYHRRSLLYLYQILYREGFLHGERRFLSNLELASRYTDGYTEEGNPHTWPITRREARELFAPLASALDIRVFGTEVRGVLKDVLPGLARRVPSIICKAWARRWGWSLWISGVKR